MTVVNCSALIITSVFYGAYLYKAVSLKLKGISTNRLARGEKPRKTFFIELVLNVLTLSTVIIQAALIFSVLPANNLPAAATVAGLLLASAGTAVFITAMAAMRLNWKAGIDSGQHTELVSGGIYKYGRNPAFLGFDLFYIGLALALTNILLIAASLSCIVLLHLQILEEERFLEAKFGERYIEYKMRTGRYFNITKRFGKR